jgi:hypothetical protein
MRKVLDGRPFMIRLNGDDDMKSFAAGGLYETFET